MKHPVHAGGQQVAGALQEEEVLPPPAGDGAGLDLLKVQSLYGENGQDLVEGAGLVGQGKEGGKLISPLPKLGYRRGHHKPGDVGGVMVDALGQDPEPVKLCCPLGADRCV